MGHAVDKLVLEHGGLFLVNGTVDGVFRVCV